MTRASIGASIVLAPLLAGIGDQLRMVADPPEGAGLISDYGTAEAAASLASINAHRGVFTAASLLLYAAMLLTIPALLAIWRVSVDRSPRWAWAGAVLATLFALGQAVHLIGHFATSLAFSASSDLNAAAELVVALDTTPLALVLFVPLYLLGSLCAIPQAVGLWRARVISPWACLAVIVGVMLFTVVGSTPLSSALWTVLVVTGLAPAAAAVLRADAATDSGAVPDSASA